MTSLRAAVAGGNRSASCVTGGRVAGASSSRLGGAKCFVVILLLAVLASCATATADFVPYRACNESLGANLHDPGEVVGEYVGDGNVRHYLFLSDRWKYDDRRDTLDLTRVNRVCPLVTGIAADHRTPIGQVWDLTARDHR